MMMSHKLHEVYERPEAPLPPDHSTGFVFAGITALLAYVWQEQDTVRNLALIATALLLLVSLARPIWLRPLNIAWMRLASLIGRVVNPIVMFILFVLLVVPAGLLMRLGYDPLRKRKNPDAASYWIVPDTDRRSDMKNQF
jgi:hypothetical protein